MHRYHCAHDTKYWKYGHDDDCSIEITIKLITK